MNEAVISDSQRRFTAVWILPLVAIVAGIWVIIHSYLNEGPQVSVTFATAEGLKAGETKVKRLSVELGVVSDVYLNEGYNDVTVIIKLDNGTQDLLRHDSQFWVVRPRIGASGVSGLTALLSGAHIELSPGQGETGRREFRGLDDMPITPLSTPGAHVVLVADKSGSASVGSPVLYQGYRVGQIEQVNLNVVSKQVNYQLFIEAPYNDLINSNTRFWNASGISVTAGIDGVSLQTESLEALISGGVAFGLPAGLPVGKAVSDRASFILHPNFDAINEQPYQYQREFMLVFDTSVRGLEVGAPVEYRGIQIGSVLDMSLDLLPEEALLNSDGHTLVPALIRIDPGRVQDDSEEALAEVDQFIRDGVKNGLRASLANGNLLTGSLYVDLDFYKDAKPMTLRAVGKHTLLPTTETRLGQLQNQVAAVLAKLQGLPLEKTLNSASNALGELGKAVKTADQTLKSVDSLLADKETKALPAELKKSLQSLRTTLSGLSPQSPLYEELELALMDLQQVLKNTSSLTKTLDNKPNELIFSSPLNGDVVPEVQP